MSAFDESAFAVAVSFPKGNTLLTSLALYATLWAKRAVKNNDVYHSLSVVKGE